MATLQRVVEGCVDGVVEEKQDDPVLNLLRQRLNSYLIAVSLNRYHPFSCLDLTNVTYFRLLTGLKILKTDCDLVIINSGTGLLYCYS